MSKVMWIVIAMILWVFVCAWWFCNIKGQCSEKPLAKADVQKNVPAKVVREPAPIPEPVPEPAPELAPIPEPVPEPAPEPAPIPEPVPEPKPAFICTDYLKGTLKLGQASNTSVDATKVEEFLNQYEGASLAVDGVYGAADEQAVRSFQQKYSQSVLEPLGLAGPTGHVLGYTRAQINKLYCQYKEAE